MQIRLFSKAMKNPKKGSVAIIAEVKLASPGTGVLGQVKDITSRVRKYEKAEADAISVITEKTFFNGRLDFVVKAKGVTKLPVLQKDFVTYEKQIYESRDAGADAILLIARLVPLDKLKDFILLSQKLGLEPVVEVFNKPDLTNALKTSTKIIAVNARDLDTFVVDVDKACKLLKQIPDKFIKLGFSGVENKKEMEKYKKAGANGILIGTGLMKAKNIRVFLERIRI